MNSRTLISVALLVAGIGLHAGEDPISPPPKNQDPTVPERGYFAQTPHAWDDFHKQFLERARQGGIDLLFLGDSLAQGWGDASQKDLWKNYFEPYKAANFGLGGDRTQQVLWRISNGEIDGIAPKVIVLSIGTNNLWVGDSAEKIAAGINAIVQLLRQKLPKTRILLLGILLRRRKAARMKSARRSGSLMSVLQKLADGANVRFIDAGSKLVDAAGNIDPDKDFYQPDHVHLKTKGYEILAVAIKPVLIEMLK